MADNITRCPKCQTAFRVQDVHLKTAKGAVRCGSCLHIFDARAHLVKTAAAIDGKKSSTAGHSRSSPPLESDDFLISDDMDEAELDRDDEHDDNVFVSSHGRHSEINLFERRSSSQAEQETEAADESWALKLLEDGADDEHQPPAPKAGSPTQPKPNKPAREKAVEQKPALERVDHFKLLNDAPADTSAAEEHTAKKKPLPITAKHPPEKAALAATEPPTAQIKAETAQKPVDNRPVFEDGPLKEPAPTRAKGTYVHAIEPEPLELVQARRRRLTQSNVFWMLLSLAAMLLAAAQLGYYRFDDWSRRPSLRPYYATACNVIGCTLPELVDLSKIRIQNMVVVDHPDKPGMLLVDATLINRAAFPQRFPTLELTFTTVNNVAIGQFLFRPDEYVSGELAGHTDMPANRPIHIDLEIADPGQQAVNYHMAIAREDQ